MNTNNTTTTPNNIRHYVAATWRNDPVYFDAGVRRTHIQDVRWFATKQEAEAEMQLVAAVAIAKGWRFKKGSLTVESLF